MTQRERITKPSYLEVRRRIENVNDIRFKRCLQYLLLIAGRVSEAVSKVAPKDINTVPRGPMGRDISFRVFDNENKIEAVVFTVRTAKRDGYIRLCALPLNPVYESWSRELAFYFSKFDKNDFIFPFNRQKVWAVARKVFKGLKYPIEDYRIKINNNDKILVKRHLRDFGVHALRHVRASDLVDFYGFGPSDLSLFAGWALSSTLGSSMMGRYLDLNWRSYFPKLLRERY